jgi:Na+/melibiose symporter-like transporter
MVVVPSLFWLVYFVSFVEACITQFFNPASIALVPQVVGKDYLQEANALNSFSGSLSRLIGPLLGGVLLTIVGSASTIIADGVSYVSSALMITLVLVPLSLPEKSSEHIESESMTKRVSYWRDWLDGLIMIKEENQLRVLFLVVALAALADGVINALLVVFPASILHLGSSQYGEMLTALGIGTLIGSFLTGQLAKKVSSARFLWGGLLGKGLTYLLIFNTRSFPVILILFALSGTPTVGWQVSTQTLLQTSVEDRLRGRVFGAYVAILSFFLLIGTGIGSVLTVPFSIVTVLDIGCSLFLVAGVVALYLCSLMYVPV